VGVVIEPKCLIHKDLKLHKNHTNAKNTCV
jgi:hypothetical protein